MRTLILFNDFMDSKNVILEGGLKQAISICWYSSMNVQNLISTVPQHGYKEINVVQSHTTANDKHCGGRVLFICTNFLMSPSVNNLVRKVAKLVNDSKC